MKKHLLTCMLCLLFTTIGMTAAAQVRNALAPTPIKAAGYEYETSEAEAKIRVEYPENGTEAFRAAYERTVLGAALELCFGNIEDAAPEGKKLLDADNVAQLLAESFIRFSKGARQEWLEAKNADLEPGDTPMATDDFPGFRIDLDVERVADNPRYQTYRLFADVYLGGAHGLQYEYYFTLESVTGTHFGLSDLFPDSLHGKLTAIVYRNLAEQMKFDGRLPDDFPALADFTLPGVPAVGLLKEGVRFQYQPYEICSYASGMPACIVPYSQLYAILSEAAKPLVNYVPKRRGIPTPIKGGKRMK
ncbi:MAG: DUF3298 domain-containing protein [Alloprevotella sp.]|nr:DUF3298 domain-containing protein [Alloprevotella sp.]